jgi:hypothetical protein
MDAGYPRRQSRYPATNSPVGSLGNEGATYFGDVYLERPMSVVGRAVLLIAIMNATERLHGRNWSTAMSWWTARGRTPPSSDPTRRGRPALTWQAFGRLFLVDTAWADAAASPLAYP